MIQPSRGFILILLLAKDFGVSDKAAEKWCKAYGIEKPPRGYWLKKAYAKLSK
jgi:hypothetical protein